MFDRDGYGNVQVALLPHETLHIPLTFMTLVPHTAPSKIQTRRSSMSTAAADAKQTRSSQDVTKAQPGDKPASHAGDHFDLEDESPRRTAEVRVISGTHGHIVAVLRVLICPRPFVVHRTLRFFEAENSIMKRRIQLVDFGMGSGSTFPGDAAAASKYVHCVEGGEEDGSQSKVVIEWGPANSNTTSGGTGLDLLLRYRCGSFPHVGSFYLILYNDPYQSEQHEVNLSDIYNFAPSSHKTNYSFIITSI